MRRKFGQLHEQEIAIPIQNHYRAYRNAACFALRSVPASRHRKEKIAKPIRLRAIGEKEDGDTLAQIWFRTRHGANRWNSFHGQHFCPRTERQSNSSSQTAAMNGREMLSYPVQYWMRWSSRGQKESSSRFARPVGMICVCDSWSGF